jgi:5S rRNA maturation endonuclease (ribonuclease M5)
LVYKDGYACTTHECHKVREFGPNLFGLIRHLTFRATGQVMTFKDAVIYAERHKDRLRGLVPEGDRYRGRRTSPQPRAQMDAAQLEACLKGPDPYYLGRGYDAATLYEFGIGTCIRPLPDGKRLMGWSIIPVYHGWSGFPDVLVGYTARNPACRPGDRKTRWLVSFEKSRYLFNLRNATRNRGPVIFCEGPGDVLRFWQAGYKRAVATFGASISEDQLGLQLMISKRHERVYFAADNDEAGRRHAESASRRIGTTAEVIYPAEGCKDFGDMTADQIRSMGL